MKYTEVHIQLSPIEPFRDLLVWALGDKGPYDSFADTADGLLAYVTTDNYDPAFLQQAIAENCDGCSVQFQAKPMADKNWNEEWEKQHQPELVEAPDNITVWVRAPFHPARPESTYEVVIEPKMSFGTAHHPTTRMMIALVATTPTAGLRVLDMGSGTGVLAILAAMRGAAHVDAVDIDEWAYNNALENARHNNVDIHPRLGDASLLPSLSVQKYDLVLANINLNILLRDMPAYAAALREGGTLAVSGFYESDVPTLLSAANTLGLAMSARQTSDGWCALQLHKK